LLEQSTVHLKLVGSLPIERIFWIRFEEQILKAVDDRVDGQDGLPILAEDVEADVAFEGFC
jgi:hypothetical protein